jgi:Lrp/AsnC family leucine-responsive transcriptional regulator
MNLDNTDLEILKLLKENSRIQWRDIGEAVHLSGPAVAHRVQRLEKAGVIRRFTLETDPSKLGNPLRLYITVFMKTANHQAFLDFVRDEPAITRADRISGHGCYLLIVQLANEAALNLLLEQILTYGNYQLNISIGTVKD